MILRMMTSDKQRRDGVERESYMVHTSSPSTFKSPVRHMNTTKQVSF